MFNCKSCGAPNGSLLDAMDHADECQPAPAPDKHEDVRAYIARIA